MTAFMCLCVRYADRTAVRFQQKAQKWEDMHVTHETHVTPLSRLSKRKDRLFFVREIPQASPGYELSGLRCWDLSAASEPLGSIDIHVTPSAKARHANARKRVLPELPRATPWRLAARGYWHPSNQTSVTREVSYQIAQLWGQIEWCREQLNPALVSIGATVGKQESCKPSDFKSARVSVDLPEQ